MAYNDWGWAPYPTGLVTFKILTSSEISAEDTRITAIFSDFTEDVVTSQTIMRIIAKRSFEKPSFKSPYDPYADDDIAGDFRALIGSGSQIHFGPYVMVYGEISDVPPPSSTQRYVYHRRVEDGTLSDYSNLLKDGKYDLVWLQARTGFQGTQYTYYNASDWIPVYFVNGVGSLTFPETGMIGFTVYHEVLNPDYDEDEDDRESRYYDEYIQNGMVLKKLSGNATPNPGTIRNDGLDYTASCIVKIPNNKSTSNITIKRIFTREIENPNQEKIFSNSEITFELISEEDGYDIYSATVNETITDFSWGANMYCLELTNTDGTVITNHHYLYIRNSETSPTVTVTLTSPVSNSEYRKGDILTTSGKLVASSDPRGWWTYIEGEYRKDKTSTNSDFFRAIRKAITWPDKAPWEITFTNDATYHGQYEFEVTSSTGYSHFVLERRNGEYLNTWVMDNASRKMPIPVKFVKSTPENKITVTVDPVSSTTIDPSVTSVKLTGTITGSNPDGAPYTLSFNYTGYDPSTSGEANATINGTKWTCNIPTTSRLTIVKGFNAGDTLGNGLQEVWGETAYIRLEKKSPISLYSITMTIPVIPGYGGHTGNEAIGNDGLPIPLPPPFPSIAIPHSDLDFFHTLYPAWSIPQTFDTFYVYYNSPRAENFGFRITFNLSSSNVSNVQGTFELVGIPGVSKVVTLNTYESGFLFDGHVSNGFGVMFHIENYCSMSSIPSNTTALLKYTFKATIDGTVHTYKETDYGTKVYFKIKDPNDTIQLVITDPTNNTEVTDEKITMRGAYTTGKLLYGIKK